MSATMNATWPDDLHPARISAYCRSWAREIAADISAKAKHLLEYMADLVDWRRAIPSAFASVKTYAGWLKIKKRATQYALRELERAGLIIADGKHRGRTTRYRLAFDPVAWMHLKGAPSCTPETAIGARRCTQTLDSKNNNYREEERGAREAGLSDFESDREEEASEPAIDEPWPWAEPAGEPTPEPVAAGPDPAPAESVLEGRCQLDGQGDDLKAWQPNPAEIALAFARGAEDIGEETKEFLKYHQDEHTPLANLSRRWPGWCRMIKRCGPAGSRGSRARPGKFSDAQVAESLGNLVDRCGHDAVADFVGVPRASDGGTAAADDPPWNGTTIDADTAAVVDDPADHVSTDPASPAELDRIMDRIRSTWPIAAKFNPPEFFADMRKDLAPFPAATLWAALEKARSTVDYLTIARLKKHLPGGGGTTSKGMEGWVKLAATGEPPVPRPPVRESTVPYPAPRPPREDFSAAVGAVASRLRRRREDDDYPVGPSVEEQQAILRGTPSAAPPPRPPIPEPVQTAAEQMAEAFPDALAPVENLVEIAARRAAQLAGWRGEARP